MGVGITGWTSTNDCVLLCCLITTGVAEVTLFVTAGGGVVTGVEIFGGGGGGGGGGPRGVLRAGDGATLTTGTTTVWEAPLDPLDPLLPLLPLVKPLDLPFFSRRVGVATVVERKSSVERRDVAKARIVRM